MIDYNQFNHFFFVGIAGTGMSAIAQYIRGVGKKVSGSDRLFSASEKMLIQSQLEQQGIECHPQDASGVDNTVDVLVVSTAIEESNVELQKARSLGITVMKRSELLASISSLCPTIAVGGTSGKSTTTAMIFHILRECGGDPSIISGAGLVDLQEKGLPGNAWNGKGKWLVIEADESDGSIVNYHPAISVLLNVDRDHKEADELMHLFSTFKANTTEKFIVNQSHSVAKQLSMNTQYDFGAENDDARFSGSNFKQEGFSISFDSNGLHYTLPLIGRHNMENALAAIAVSNAAGVSAEQCCEALKSYRGIYRRTQVVGSAKGCWVIDDFAHNPSEVVAAIKACQQVGKRVWAWFQPHGFGPLRFMHEELETDVQKCLRSDDCFLLSDVYYAGGTVSRDVTSDMVARKMESNGANVRFFADRNVMLPFLKTNVQSGDVILIMGARDNSLTDFAKHVYNEVLN